MELMTISEVSKAFNVSTRTLRYYEEIGLLDSCKKPDYAYRVYSDDAIKRLQQIVALRKLRIPLKQIAFIFDNDDLSKTLAVLQETVNELDGELAALNTVRSALGAFMARISEHIGRNARYNLLTDEETLKIIGTLSISPVKLKEEKSMDELNNAAKVLDKLNDIRIVYLPPATVAATQYTGPNPEDVSGKQLYEFIDAKNLPEIKKDFRIYGFNNPSPEPGKEFYGYEFWVTIPEDMEIAEPMTKKTFAGGLYATHCIKMGDFHEWQTFMEQMQKSEEYEIEWREPWGMGGCLEEELNVYTFFTDKAHSGMPNQLDLLIPIKKK